MQLDFMSNVDGIRSFESLRARASRVEFKGGEMLVADLRDVIRSKEAAARRRTARCFRCFGEHWMSKKPIVTAVATTLSATTPA